MVEEVVLELVLNMEGILVAVIDSAAVDDDDDWMEGSKTINPSVVPNATIQQTKRKLQRVEESIWKCISNLCDVEKKIVAYDEP